MLARHRSDTYLNEALFRRIDALKAKRDRARAHARAGAGRSTATISISSAPARARRPRPKRGWPRSASGSRRSPPSSARTCWRTRRRGRSGSEPAISTAFPISFVASAARLAAERGEPGRYAVTLSRSSIEPFLQFSARRDLREAAFRAWAARGENGGATDNRAIAAETVRLRAERARLLGYESHAHYRLADTMAKTPERRARPARIGLGARAPRPDAGRRRRCRRSRPARAATSRSRRGTGAISRRSDARPSSISTRAR